MLRSSTGPHLYSAPCGACQTNGFTMSTLSVNSRFLYCHSNHVPISCSPRKCPNCTYAAAVKGVNCKYYPLNGNQFNTAGNATSNLKVSAQRTTSTVTFYANPPPPQYPGGTSFVGETEAANTSYRKMSFDEYEELMDTTQQSRRRNLEITGIPVTEDEDIYLILYLIATTIRVYFRREAILSARRLRIPDSVRREGKVLHPHIVVTFVNKQAKMVWSDACRGRKLMAGDLMGAFPCTRVFVNDHLTWMNKVTLGTARRHVRNGDLAFAWTVDCKILVKKTATGPTVRVFSLDDLESVVKEAVH